MRRILVFRLYGPLASWGEIAVGEIRGSAARPTRSALLGLIGAALGIDRGDDPGQRRLSSSVRFAVRTDAPGVPIVDYHTVQWRKPTRGEQLRTRADTLRVPRRSLSTVQSWRHFRCDALYTVAVWSAGGAAVSLEEIREALLRPHFSLSLGRKACPLALPLAPRIVEAMDLASALAAFDRESPLPAALRRSPFSGQPWLELSWDLDPQGPPAGAAEEEATHIQRRDEPVSRRRWRFASRPEALGRVPAPDQEGSHAAESSDAP